MPQRPVVLVTGSAQRIGLAIAQDLAAHGWDVAVHYRHSAAAAAQAVAGLRAARARAHAVAAHLAAAAAGAARVPAVVGA
ncbi:MAG: SDR family NAD(P)-dependent oxidoreductase, partial [Betaproteobacteria bacterium]